MLGNNKWLSKTRWGNIVGNFNRSLCFGRYRFQTEQQKHIIKRNTLTRQCGRKSHILFTTPNLEEYQRCGHVFLRDQSVCQCVGRGLLASLFAVPLADDCHAPHDYSFRVLGPGASRDNKGLLTFPSTRRLVVSERTCWDACLRFRPALIAISAKSRTLFNIFFLYR